MQRMIGARRQHRVAGDQILDVGDLGRQDDPVAGKACLFGKLGRYQCRLHDGFAHHLLRRQRKALGLVVIHQAGQKLLVERAPVDADTHRLVELDGAFDDFDELLVLLRLEADIARIDAIFRQRLGAGRMIGEKLVADIMEIADQRHIKAKPFQTLADLRHRSRTLVAIHSNAHQLRACPVKSSHLGDGRIDIGRIGIGHRLDDHGRRSSDDHPANIDGNGGPTGLRFVIEGGRHESPLHVLLRRLFLRWMRKAALSTATFMD